MASTLTLLSSSTHALKYRLVSDGVNDAIKTRAQMIADAASGAIKITPLYLLLGGSPQPPLVPQPMTLAAWAALPDSDKLTIYVTPISTTAGAFFTQVGPDLVMQVPPCVVGEANVEVRLIHSAVR